jgi:hypothetical protein
VLLAPIAYAAAGTLHFVKPAPYLRITPPYNPWHVFMVRVIGLLKSPAVWDFFSQGRVGQRRGDWWRS